MAVSATLPSKKRIKRTDPCKFKHRLFHQNASLEQISKICRTTSAHQTNEMKHTLHLTASRNAKMNKTISELEEEVAASRSILNSLPVLSPPVQVAHARAPTTGLRVEARPKKRRKKKARKSKKSTPAATKLPASAVAVAVELQRFPSYDAAGELGNESLDNLDLFQFDLDAVSPFVAGDNSVDMQFETEQEIQHLENQLSLLEQELEAIPNEVYDSNEDDDEVITNNLSI